MTQPTATPLSQTVELRVTGQPDVRNKYGSGHLRPDRVVFRYRADRVTANLWGSWVRADGELTGAPADQVYHGPVEDADWPDWLAALAREHQPDGMQSTDSAGDAFTAADMVAALRAAGAEKDELHEKELAELRRKLSTSERIRENADFHLGQEMARRQLAEKEVDRLRAELRRMAGEPQQDA